MKKSFVAFGAALALTVLPSYSSIASKATFSDVEGHWFSESVVNAVIEGYIDGYDDGTFRPELELSRGEFVKMVVTATHLTTDKVNPGSDLYAPYVTAAMANGLLLPSDFQQKDLNNPISRVEMAKMALRATSDEFKGRAIDDRSAMLEAVRMGLIQGVGYGEIAPSGKTNRAQSVTIVDRILKARAGVPLEVDQKAVSNAELAKSGSNILSRAADLLGGEATIPLDPLNMSLETPDGLYKVTVESIVAIDLEDPNDPNLDLLGDLGTLRWFNLSDPISSPLVQHYPKSYVLYFKHRVDFNHDPIQYDDRIGVVPDVTGFTGDVTDLNRNILSRTATVFRNVPGDTPAVIIPKQGFVAPGNLAIVLNAPMAQVGGNRFSKTIMSVKAPVQQDLPDDKKTSDQIQKEIDKRMKEIQEMIERQMSQPQTK
ncbi:S-layer homology domain-containing protein [Paenibacillus sp. GYB003]|uniref:S-layer homology domain-containing protein n=1 Tax=Paenibacillus sp. GYB003 TaxID=2994392 RepID=UPI002F96C86E